MNDAVMWDLVSAVAFARSLEPFLRSEGGWTCALGGSVLQRGWSRKDLDLICFPMRTSRADARELRAGLRRIGMKPLWGVEVVRARWRREFGSDDRKHVEVWRTASKARVDVFVMEAREGLLPDIVPACPRCLDTHYVSAEDGRDAMCLACPVPCSACREGAYCAEPRCECPCHRKETDRG